MVNSHFHLFQVSQVPETSEDLKIKSKLSTRIGCLDLTHLAWTGLKSTVETLEKSEKYVQS